MSYSYYGFFAAADGAVLEAALRRWPGCRGCMVDTPFTGIGLACPDPNDPAAEDEVQARFALVGDVEHGLPSWSRAFPAIVFVYLEAECFGGICLYGGYACQDGAILARESITGRTVDESAAGLRRLLAYLGVQRDGHYFEPFERGYFDA